MTKPLNPSLWRVLLPPLLGGAQTPDPETAAAFKQAVADPAVQRLIATCVNELLQLVRQGGADHFLHAAVQGAATLETTPGEWLEVQLGMLRAEIEQARKERCVAVDRRRAEYEAAKPLTDAVNRVSMQFTLERDNLLRRLEVHRSNAPRESRWTKLRAAGLSDDEISRLDLKAEDQDQERQAAEWRERIAALNAQIAKCVAYGQDPLHDPEQVRGLGFDHLVDAQLSRATAAV